jgi:GNAT superfamily N-acetyltransferase
MTRPPSSLVGSSCAHPSRRAAILAGYYLPLDEQRGVRVYRAEDRLELQRLFAHRSGPWAEVGFWEWQYQHNPAGSSIGSVLEMAGRPRGQIGSFPVRFRLAGRSLRVAHDHDLVIAPEARSLLALRALLQARAQINALADIPFLYGCVPKENAAMLESLAGAQSVAPIPQLRCRLDVEPALTRRLRLPRVAARILAAPLNRQARWRRRHLPLPEGLHWEEFEQLDGRTDRLWRQLRNDYPLQAVRDARYLNWRYRQLPGPHHRFFALLQPDGELAGLCVVRPGRGDARPAQITELLAPSTAPDALWTALIRHCLEWARARREVSIQCWMFSHCPAHRHLLTAGFFSEETPDYRLLVRPTFQEWRLPGDPPPPAAGSPAAAWAETVRTTAREMSSWYLSIGDADLF